MSSNSETGTGQPHEGTNEFIWRGKSAGVPPGFGHDKHVDRAGTLGLSEMMFWRARDRLGLVADLRIENHGAPRRRHQPLSKSVQQYSGCERFPDWHNNANF